MKLRFNMIKNYQIIILINYLIILLYLKSFHNLFFIRIYLILYLNILN